MSAVPAPEPERDLDEHLLARQVGVGAAARGHPAPAQQDTVDGDVEPVRLDGGVGVPGGRRDPAPVGVRPEDRGLHQAVAGDRAGDRHGLVLGGGTGDPHGDPLGDALRVGLHLLGEVPADGRQRGGEHDRIRGDARGAGGEHEHGVVGGHAAVDVQPVEADPDGGAQRLVQDRGVDHGVRGEHGEHGGHRGSDHAGALGDAADAPAGLVGVRGLLRDGVRGHDRGGGGQPGGGVGAERGGGGLHPGEHGRRAGAACRSARWSRPRPRSGRSRGPRRPSRRWRARSGSPPARCTRSHRRS